MDPIRILLVEDDKDQAFLIRRALDRHEPRFHTSLVTDETGCLSALAGTEFALVLLDYRLPGVNGLQVLREIRRSGYRMPVIMLTAHGDEAVAVDAMKAGAADYIVKHGDYLSQLPLTVQQSLRRHHLETELALSQQRYRLLFESSRDAILILDAQDCIVDLNPRAEKLLGVERGQLRGQSIFESIRPDPSGQVASWVDALRNQKGVSRIPASFVNHQGDRRWVEVSAAWLDYPEQPGFYQLLLHDIAQSRRDQIIWNALNQASLVAHNQLAPEPIYQAVAHVLLDLGLASSLWWFDEKRRVMQIRYSVYPAETRELFREKTGLDLDDLCVSVDQLPAVWEQIEDSETVYLQEGADLLRAVLDTDDLQVIEWVVDSFNAGSVILLPLVISHKLAGMLLIHGEISEQSVPPARAFARQISSALEHARLYNDARRRIQELAALQEISFKLNAPLETRPLMEAITNVALKLTGAHNCHIYLVGEEGFEFMAARSRDGSREPAVSQPRSDGLVARVTRAATPLFINDAKHHSLYQSREAREWGVEAIAGCPLLRAGKVLGVFTLTYLEPHRFDQAEKHILKLLADQAAAAVETAQLYQDVRRRNEDLSNLYQVALAVSAQVNISDVLEAAYEAVKRTTGARTFAVGLYDETADALVYKMIREEGQQAYHPNLPLSHSQSLTAWVARNRQPLIINDMQSEPVPAPGVRVGPPTPSWMGFPLVAGERLVGVLSVQSFQPYAFDEGHQRLCQGIATQVAIALEKARLLEEVQHQNWELSVLNKVSAAVSHSFDLETLLDGALSIVLQEMALDAGAFHLLDAERQLLTLVCHRNFPPGAPAEVQEIVLGQGLCGKVALTGELTVTDNYDQDPRRSSQALSSFKTVVSLPLSSKDVVVGTLSVLYRESRQVTSQQRNLLVAIGQQIGVAVENATLYRRTIDRERRLARLSEAARSLSSVLEGQTLFQRVLKTTVDELPAGGAFLWLYDETQDLSPQMALGPLVERRAARDGAIKAEMEEVLQEKEVVLWSNRVDLERWVGAEIAGQRGYRVAVPLRGQADAFGVLEVIAAEQQDRLTANDVEFLTTLGGIAAIAHENARLYEAVAQYAISLEAKIERRTAEVRREKEQTEAILRSVADAIFVLGEGSDIILTNPAAEMLLGGSNGQAAQLRDFLRRVAQQPDSHAPGPTITLDGQALQARAAKIRQEGVELGTIIVLRDVTHFEEVNRLKSEFVSTVSHELRTPLSNLKLYLSLLERGRAEKREDYQQVLVREVKRLENLIQDLLDLSRLGPRDTTPEFEIVDLGEVASHVLLVLSPQAEAKQITLSHPPDNADQQFFVEASREQMVQMLMNLVANAVNYTETGGWVNVEFSAKTDKRGRWIVVSVRDNGVGITPNELPRIFDRFFRGKIQQHMSAGTGLGLAIVKEILDVHDGWITVESEPGVGSLFQVGLSAATPPAADE
jgi:PAS domain S-box-containing protein